MKKIWVYISLFLVSLSAHSGGLAGGKDAGAIAGGLNTEIDAFAKLVLTLFLIIGIAMAGKGILMFKKHNEDPRSNPVGLALAMVIVGGLLTVVLGVMTISPDSILGGN